jgi:hypothetical protein
MSTHRIALAFVALFFCLVADAQEFVTTWSRADADGNLTLRLNPDGTCRIEAHSNVLGQETQISCYWWRHGSRIHLRTSGQRGDEGLGQIDMEYVPQSDKLIIHGSTEMILSRHPDPSKT